MNAARSLTLIMLLALSALLGAARLTEAQVPELKSAESTYLGKVSAITEMYQSAMERGADLTRDAGVAEWIDPTWQRDMLDVEAVVIALDDEMQTIEPPARFAGSGGEIKQATSAAAEAAHYVQRGIASGDVDTFARAAPLMDEANQHVQRATELLKEEGGFSE